MITACIILAAAIVFGPTLRDLTERAYTRSVEAADDRRYGKRRVDPETARQLFAAHVEEHRRLLERQGRR